MLVPKKRSLASSAMEHMATSSQVLRLNQRWSFSRSVELSDPLCPAAEQLEEGEARTLFGSLLKRNRAAFVNAATATANATVAVS